MKKLLATSLLAVSILGLAAPASAATTNATTEGDVTFEADDTKEGGQNIVVPIDGQLIPMMPTKEDGTTMDGSKSDGALRLEFVPNFHFGTKKNSADNQSYNSQFSTGWYKQTDGSQTTMAKSPLFAQVSDETGNSSSKWSLSVKQVTPF